MWTGFVSSLPGGEVDANPKGRRAPSHPRLRPSTGRRAPRSQFAVCIGHRSWRGV